MKNKILILLFAIGGLVSSCSDAYDIQQKGEINDAYDAFRNPQDIARGINAIYSSIPGETEVEFASTFTDEISLGLENGGQGIISGEFGFNMEANNSYAASLWNSHYTMINRINRLEAISKKLMEGASTADQNAHKNNLAELYVLRAYAHYKLFAYFTPNYTNGSGLSAIILDHVPPTDYNYSLPRNTVSEVKKFILDDLEAAEDLRQAGWAGINYVNSGMIEAIRVKMYAMTEEWDKVLTHGQLILNQYSIATPTQYTSLFARVNPSDFTEPSAETIFKLKRTLNSGGNVADTWYSVNVSAEGSPFYEMGRSLYNELDKLDPSATGQDFGTSRNDIRYTINLDADTKVLTSYETASQSEFTTDDVLLVGKYQGMVGANLKNDIQIFRVSDILLAMAEARAAKGQFVGASTDPDDVLNQYTDVYSILYTIRFNRSNDMTKIVMPNITNAQSAWKAILDERRVEFAFEGHRYLDMKRIGAKANSNGFTRYSKDCAINGACNLPLSSYKMTLPIPIGEMIGNKSLTTNSQNPGYN